MDGDDDFVDPAGYDDFYTAPGVLVDPIEDKPSGIYEYEFTLPDVECDNCTLQVIQVMTDKPPWGPEGGDIYYQCADLALTTAAPSADGGVDDGMDDPMTGDSPGLCSVALGGRVGGEWAWQVV